MQGENETTQTYVVRLRSSATECSFQCPRCEHDLSGMNIKDQFIMGLSNNTLQIDILAKANQLKALDDLINHSEAFETAICDQNKLTGDQHQSSSIYAYRDRVAYSKKKSNNCSSKCPA